MRFEIDTSILRRGSKVMCVSYILAQNCIYSFHSDTEFVYIFLCPKAKLECVKTIRQRQCEGEEAFRIFQGYFWPI